MDVSVKLARMELVNALEKNPVCNSWDIGCEVSEGVTDIITKPAGNWWEKYGVWSLSNFRRYWIRNFTLAIETIIWNDRSFQRRFTIMGNITGVPERENWLSLIVAVTSSSLCWTCYDTVEH